MNDLKRELAPVTDAAWDEINEEAKRTLKTYLAARKLVDFSGPHGWQLSAANVGRTEPLGGFSSGDVQARRRTVQPLVELWAPFTLSREELDHVSRGAEDADLEPVIEAARALAAAEDRLIFYGHQEAGIDGVCSDADQNRIATSNDFTNYPRHITQALEQLRDAGIAGPYAIALGPRSYNSLASATEGGYPLIRHVERLIDGPIVWAPVLRGGVVLSLRGGDFRLIVGRDISVGYQDHDAKEVHLYLEESLTFRLLTPEAAVPLEESAK